MHWTAQKKCLAAALALLASSCGGTIPKTHYYVLDLPAPAPQVRNPAPYAVTVMPVRAPEQLEQDRIVYRTSPVEVEFYDYHRWVQRPATVLTNALADRLRAEKVFANVGVFDGKANGDYMIRARLDRLEEVDSSGNVAVRVEMAAHMVEGKTNRTVWSGLASHNGRVTEGDVKAVVAEMSRGVDNCLAQIMAGLETFAKSLPTAPGPASVGSR